MIMFLQRKFYITLKQCYLRTQSYICKKQNTEKMTITKYAKRVYMDQLIRLICWAFIKCRCPPLDVSHISPGYIFDVVNNFRVRAHTICETNAPAKNHPVHHFHFFSLLVFFNIMFLFLDLCTLTVQLCTPYVHFTLCTYKYRS